VESFKHRYPRRSYDLGRDGIGLQKTWAQMVMDFFRLAVNDQLKLIGGPGLEFALDF
jgi:hypothetical protein